MYMVKEKLKQSSIEIIILHGNSSSVQTKTICGLQTFDILYQFGNRVLLKK
jgi:hypothetical protein